MNTIVDKDNHMAFAVLFERSTNSLFVRKLTKGKNARKRRVLYYFY